VTLLERPREHCVVDPLEHRTDIEHDRADHDRLTDGILALRASATP
jgi:hypothetical protein